MRAIIREDFPYQMRALRKRGGNFKKASEKATVVYSYFRDFPEFDYTTSDHPLKELPLTNHGESRIDHCVKYDLPGRCRLITIQDQGILFLAYVGDHDECDKWLTKNIGFKLVTTDAETIDYTFIGNAEKGFYWEGDLKETEQNSTIPLLSYLKKRDQDYIDSLPMPGRNYQKLKDLYSDSAEDQVLEALEGLPEGLKDFLSDVLRLLQKDDVDRATLRIEHEKNGLIELNELKEEDVDSLKLGPGFIELKDLPKDAQDQLMSVNWKSWMLFLHPDQRQVVEQEFNGPSRLLGVSGSGKTCVLVHRAFHLVMKYKRPVLITTINHALADLLLGLIKELSELKGDEVKKYLHLIDVKSYWQVCYDFLIDYLTDDLVKRGLEEFADKSQEDVDRIWDEFVKCEENNEDFLKALDLVMTLKARGVDAHAYIKDELSLIRSSFSYYNREGYLEMEREGRKVPLTPEMRQIVLTVLTDWEDKMQHVGVSDYMNLLRFVQEHENKLTSKYRNVLIDEIQDFGTEELRLIRKMVDYDTDDIFMCGDIAQQVQVKEHKIRKAGISIIPQNFLRIIKNYRNSREILLAANQMFNQNVERDDFSKEGFELLDPQLANFSSQPPFVLYAPSFSDELEHSISYLNLMLEEGRKACIAFAGYSHFEVCRIGEELGYPVLDGEMILEDNRIYFSELNQTKGFEFDIVIIVNLNREVFPRNGYPREEQYRDISKLYVSMTRAKQELILSYSTTLSHVFNGLGKVLNDPANWDDFNDSERQKLDLSLSNQDIGVSRDFDLNGRMFVNVTRMTLSKELYLRIIKLVSGRDTLDTQARPMEFRTMSGFISALKQRRHQGHMKKLMGATLYDEAIKAFEIKIEVMRL